MKQPFYRRKSTKNKFAKVSLSNNNYLSLPPHVFLVMFQGTDSSWQQRMAARDTRSFARRRRERRLRAQWRHEQQTAAMALAVGIHHSAQRGEWRYLNEAPRGQKTASAEATNNALRSQRSSGAGDTEFFSLFEEELSGRAHRGAHCRRSDTRCSRAADCGQCDGRIMTLGSHDCRAGYRRAQDLLLLVSCLGGSP